MALLVLLYVTQGHAYYKREQSVVGEQGERTLQEEVLKMVLLVKGWMGLFEHSIGRETILRWVNRSRGHSK